MKLYTTPIFKSLLHIALAASAAGFGVACGGGSDVEQSSSRGSDTGTGGEGGTSTTGGGGQGGQGGQGGAAACAPLDQRPCYDSDPATQGVGICKAGTESCKPDGSWSGDCLNAVGPAAEACDGLDNDCNGTIDDGCTCVDGTTQSCYSGEPGTRALGECKSGTQTCADGKWGACMGEVLPSAEACDNKDNNCDGIIDDGNPGGGAACNSGMPGVCLAGTQTCKAGALTCVANVMPGAEACNGLDDNCNGMVDDGNPGGGLDCDTGLLGLCAAGTTSCKTGAIVCNQKVQAVAEACNGLDDNCNGMIDDGNPGGGGACTTGKPGVCSAGTTTCSNGALSCMQTMMPSAEVCNGLDDNCDGSIDDGNPGGGLACNTNKPGICAAGTTACSNGAVVCNQNVAMAPETCNGLDDNCNGVIDDGNPGGGGACTTNKQGICSAGTFTCTNGALVCAQTNQAVNEICGNGLDDDCNGAIDNGCGALCGNGVLEPGEACDDGNGIDTDACTNACVLGPLAFFGSSNATPYILSALNSLGQSFSQPAGSQWGVPSNTGIIISSDDGGSSPFPDYNAHLAAGAHVLIIGGSSLPEVTAWISGYVNTDGTANWHQADDCVSDWNKAGAHAITQFMPATYEFTNESVSYHMVHFTAAQPANTFIIGNTCHGAVPGVLVTRRYPGGGTFTYMAFDLGPYNDANSENGFVKPFLQGYLAYVRGPH